MQSETGRPIYAQKVTKWQSHYATTIFKTIEHTQHKKATKVTEKMPNKNNSIRLNDENARLL